MERLEVTWKHAIIVWWSLVWRGVLFGMLAASVAGFILGLIMGVLGKGESAEVYGQLAGLVAGIPVGIWVVKTILTKEFGNFRIALVPSTEALMEKAVRETSV
jgi:hypothetical protein